MLKDLVSKFTNDLLSGIGAEIIHRHYLISPSDSFQTGSNIPLFVVRDDNRRDLPWIHGMAITDCVAEFCVSVRVMQLYTLACPLSTCQGNAAT